MVERRWRIGETMEPCTNTTLRSTVVLLFFSGALSFLVSFSSSAVSEYLYDICPNTTRSYSNSAYQSKLNILLSSLPSDSKSAFRYVTVRQSSVIVYANFYCRGDVTSDICRDCVHTAGREIVQRCPNRTVGYIWYDKCTLRYSDQSFFNNFSDYPVVYMWNTQNITDPTRFNQLLGDTMNEAATKATTNSERFATREATFTQFQKLYCLTQCSPDLSGNDCDTCLVGAIADLPDCCSGKQGGRVFNPSCNIRYEVYPFYQDTASAPAPSPTLASSPPPSNRTTVTEKQGSSSGIIVAIVVPVVAAGLIIFSVLLYCLLIQKKKEVLSKENGEDAIKSIESFQLDFSEVLAATNNFADVNKIGVGGFGNVYMGKLPNGQEIAVKRLSANSGQGVEEFKNEVVLVAKLQHRNLIRLLGFCLEGEEKILVYEFVPNKSLDHFLFDPVKCVQLDWQRRYKIIQGIARGLLYLHEDSCLRIIHRDLKASNILLDGDMIPKISDFGMARIFVMDQTQANTNRIAGTFGYMSPEYVIHGQFSVKSDVYSFGVLVLEIVSGKKNSSFYQTDCGEDIISYAWRHWNAGTALEFIDPILREHCSRSEVMRCILIGLLCVQEDVADRPTMTKVVLMLDSYSVTVPLPSQPVFFLGSSPLPVSENEVSITELEPR